MPPKRQAMGRSTPQARKKRAASESGWKIFECMPLRPVRLNHLNKIGQRGDGPCSLLVLRSERRYASQQEAKPKSRKLLWSITGATLVTGAAIVYAKNNPEFREWLSINAPWADNVVSVVYQEKNSIGQWASTHISSLNKSVSGFLFGKEGIIPEKKRSAADQDLTAKAKFGPQDYNLPKPALAPHYVEEKKTDIVPECPAAVVVKSEPVCDPPLPPLPVSKDLVEMEKCLREFTKTAIDNYHAAAEACVTFNRALDKIVEASVEELDKSKFDKLRATGTERNDAVMVAEHASKEAERLLEDLSKRLGSGVAAPPEAVAATKRQLTKFRADLKAARDDYNCQREKSCIADKYWQKVEAARRAYVDELEALYPGLDVNGRRLTIDGGDPDLLLVHSLRQVLSLQRQLIELQTTRELRLQRAIESHNERELIDAKVKEIITKERYNLDQEFAKKNLALRAEAEKKLKCELKKQMDLHQELLQDKLDAKEKEVLARLDRAVSERVEKERLAHKAALAKVTATLKAIEDTLKARAKAEEASRRSQSLWAAGESLLAATRRQAGVAKVDQEINAVEKAGANDELVKSVVKSIPKEVREKGIFTETALKENYAKMEKTALKVALVSKDGAPLPVYMLSWLQSFLLFSKISDIPKSELENQPTDFSQMDAFDILQRARYWMERNDIASALRYVNLLEGASRAASDTWREAAARHLETRQAAEAIMAHAAAAALASM